MTKIKVILDFAKALLEEYASPIFFMSLLISILGLAYNFLLVTTLGIGNTLDLYLYSLALPMFISTLIGGSIQYCLGPKFVMVLSSGSTDIFHKIIRTIMSIFYGFLVLGLIAVPYQVFVLPTNPQQLVGLDLYALLSISWFSGSIMILTNCTVAILNSKRRFLTALSLSIYPYLLPAILLFAFGIRISPILLALVFLISYCMSLVVSILAIGEHIKWENLKNITDISRETAGALFKTMPTLFCFSSFAIIDAFWATRMSEGSLSILALCQRIVISAGSLIITSPYVKIANDIMTIKHHNDFKIYFKSLFTKLVLMLSALILAIFIFKDLIASVLIRNDITNIRARFTETIVYLLPGMGFMLLSVVLTKALYCFPENSFKLPIMGFGWMILYFIVSMILMPLDSVGSAIAYSISWLMYLSFCIVLIRKQFNSSRQSQ